MRFNELCLSPVFNHGANNTFFYQVGGHPNNVYYPILLIQ